MFSRPAIFDPDALFRDHLIGIAAYLDPVIAGFDIPVRNARVKICKSTLIENELHRLSLMSFKIYLFKSLQFADCSSDLRTRDIRFNIQLHDFLAGHVTLVNNIDRHLKSLVILPYENVLYDSPYPNGNSTGIFFFV